MDIGCGSGVILSTMDTLGFNVVGIDTSHEAIEICKGIAKRLSHDHALFEENICDFTVTEGQYRVVVAMSSLVAMRYEEMMSVINKIKTGVKEEGLVYIEAFTTKDPIYSEPDKYLPAGEHTFFHPKWRSFMYLFRPGELLHRFKDFDILDYREVVSTDWYPTRHHHHEARLCARKKRMLA